MSSFQKAYATRPNAVFFFKLLFSQTKMSILIQIDESIHKRLKLQLVKSQLKQRELN